MTNVKTQSIPTKRDFRRGVGAKCRSLTFVLGTAENLRSSDFKLNIDKKKAII